MSSYGTRGNAKTPKMATAAAKRRQRVPTPPGSRRQGLPAGLPGGQQRGAGPDRRAVVASLRSRFGRTVKSPRRGLPRD